MRLATKLSVGVVAVAAPVMMAQAQSGAAGATKSVPRAVANVPRMQNGACASLANAPSDLVRSPEGLAILRLKRELDGAATVMVQRGGARGGIDQREVAQLQRGVDSVMQVIVRTHGNDGTANSNITIRRGDSTIVMNGKVVEGRPLFESSDGPNKHVEVFVRELEPRLKEFATVSARAINRASATGYLGLSMSGAQVRVVTDSGSFTSHCDYPVIEAVDVGSPARTAGLEAGDTIVAYNGRDVVAQTVNYPQLLVPGKAIKVRVRRDGKTREFAVTVGERAPEQAESFTFSTSTRSPMASTVPPFTTKGSFFVRPMGESGGVVSSISSSSATVLGAQLNVLDEELAKSLGLEPGLLIMRVTTGTPAADAGLKAGEVVRALNGTSLREVGPIVRAVKVPGAHEVKLTVIGRDAPARTVTLKF